MEILYQDSYFVAIEKPAGFHVHPPEDPQFKIPREKICLYQVRDQLKTHVFPVHRLDAGTSGVLLFALSSESARDLGQIFSQRTAIKNYQAVVRGFTPLSGDIDIPLPSDSTGDLQEAFTSYTRRATLELPFAVGKRHPTVRYSLVDITISTGRFHQIRRHFNRISHPLLGDAYHGDSKQNQFFRNHLGISGLCLRATQLQFKHPWTGENLIISSGDCPRWNKIQALFPPS